nr:hypothetical protein [Chlamydiota bacterium]
GISVDAYAQIGHTPVGPSHLALGDVSVGLVHGKILIQGGEEAFTQAVIGHGVFDTNQAGRLEGAISVTQEVVPATGNDLFILSGAAEAASAGIGFVPTNGVEVNIVSERVSVDTNAPITLRTVDGEAQTVIGVFESDLGQGNAFIREISVKTSRDLILQPGNGTGGIWGGAIIGSSIPTPGISNSTINIEARDMFWFTKPAGFPIVINHNSLTGIGVSDITITTRNAFVGVDGLASEDALIVTGRNMLLIADQDIQLGPSAIFRAAGGAANPPPPSGSGEITLVVDNAFPSAPDIGPGRFITNRARIETRGPLRIFTAKRIQNTINGPIKFDGSEIFFVPGSLLIDSDTERWKSYFPDSFGGFPFTVFYKEALPLFVNLYGRAISDMFKNLATYDEFLFAPKCFLLGFDTLWYDEPLHLHGEVSSFDLFRDKTYQLLRPRYRNYQTKYVESF